MKSIELLAPAGNMQKLKTAIHFGADAVYLSGKEFGLRAFSENFSCEEIGAAVKLAHKSGKKVYVTVNIYAKERDFNALPDYIKFLHSAEVDAVLVSDPGIIYLIKEIAPNLDIHLSTQANTTNSYAVRFWAEQGIKRIVLARECTLDEIAVISHSAVEVEVFVHGAMCVSMSGRCLLSDYLCGRSGNRGECVQACRWEWIMREKGHFDKEISVIEDERGTYFLNSKDLNMLSHLNKFIQLGVDSVKIEGRMKSEYYLATVVNAYRRALDNLFKSEDIYRLSLPQLEKELLKAGHRKYTTGFFLPDGEVKQFYEHSKAVQEGEFTALVLGWEKGVATLEMRNRFREGQKLEILSPGNSFGETVIAASMSDIDCNPITDVKLVQQTVFLPCPYPLFKGDILRTYAG